MCRKDSLAPVKGCHFKFLAALLLVLCFVLLSVSVLGEDNATGGDGKVDWALKDYAWYNPKHFLWKVSIYAGKSERSGKDGSLTSDYWYIGTVYMKRTDWTAASSGKYGNLTKVEALAGSALSRESAPLILTDASVPLVPIASGGNVSAVKSYFGKTGTVSTLLEAIAAREGKTSSALLGALKCTIGGVTKTGWPSAELYPDGVYNKIPWVIVYEPVIEMHLKDGSTILSFTATEFALAQKNGWYDWFYSGGRGQAVSKLTHSHLPTSVQLEESWFGYSVYGVTDDEVVWSNEDVIRGGGWGMRYLPSRWDLNHMEYAVRFVSAEQPPASGGTYPVTVCFENNANVWEDVLCELYNDTELLWSESINLYDYSSVNRTFQLFYSPGERKNLIARINYARRNEEENPKDNKAIKNVVTGTTSPDFSVVSLTVPETVREGQDVLLRTKVRVKGAAEAAARVVIRLDGTVLYDGWQTLTESPTELTQKVTKPALGSYLVSVEVNPDACDLEPDPGDNRAEASFEVVPFVDFSVKNLTVSPSEAEAGNPMVAEWIVENGNPYAAYENIEVTLWCGTEVVGTYRVSLPKGGSTRVSATVPTAGLLGTYTFYAEVNRSRAVEEADYTNNRSLPVSVKVKSSLSGAIRFLVPNASLRPGTQVILSGIVSGASRDIFKKDEATVTLKVYSGSRCIFSETREDVVLPVGEEGYVPFRLTVPENLESSLRVTVTFSAGGTVLSTDTKNVSFESTPTYVAADTKYERSAPAGFRVPSAPRSTSGAATWTEWTETNGVLKRQDYAVTLRVSGSLTLENGVGNVTKSGYGIFLSASASLNGSTHYVTGIQRAAALYPEFSYTLGAGVSDTLEKSGTSWTLLRSGAKAAHYTPLWYPDGNYRLVLSAYDVWTPCGMLEARVVLETEIEGSAYDDWFVR